MAPVPSDEARVIVYWSDQAAERVFFPPVYVDGKLLGQLQPFGYLDVMVPRGTREVRVTTIWRDGNTGREVDKTPTLQVVVAGGDTALLEYKAVGGSVLPVESHLTQVDLAKMNTLVEVHRCVPF
ncbi:MAG: hypothetical protein IT438_00490 [Phycisphaerales bacterium]|nr:hypothetical protein [Phycisphaerales bacterium]